MTHAPCISAGPPSVPELPTPRERFTLVVTLLVGYAMLTVTPLVFLLHCL
jgi:hypothetical protein